MKIRYRRITVDVGDVKKPDRCEACGKPSKKLQHHHVVYRYETKEVRKNPKLALRNTIILCYFDHKIGNSLSLIHANKERALKLRKLIKQKGDDEKIVAVVEKMEKLRKKKLKYENLQHNLR